MTWFRAGFPVKTYPLREKWRGLTWQDLGFGRKCGGSLARYDRDSCSWKIPQLLLLGGLEPFSETWPRWGTMRNGECWGLSTPGHLTSGNESGLWRTPAANEPGVLAERLVPIEGGIAGGMNRHFDKHTGRMAQIGLSQQVKLRELWPTPDCRGFTNDGSLQMLAKKATTREEWSAMSFRKGFSAKQKLWPTPQAHKTTESGCIVNAGGSPWDGISKPHSAKTGRPITTALADAVKMFPTPTVCGNYNRKGLSATSGDGLATVVSKYPTLASRDWWHPNRRSYSERGGGTKGEQLPNAVGGALNPDWVEWLMGWPVGWTCLDPLDTLEIAPWDIEPQGVPRVASGVKSRVDRLKAIGNGQVPAVAAMAWETLTQRWGQS